RPDAGSPHRPSADSPHRPAADSRLQPRADSQLRPGTGSPLRTDTDSPLRPVEAALGPLADEVRALRVELSATLRRRLIAAARDIAPDLPITLHANPDPWATGPFAALPSGEPGADVLVGNCWGDPTEDAARLTHLSELCAPGQRVGAYVLTLPPRPADPDHLAELLTTYTKAGASEFHLYHAGLAGPQRLTAITRALELTAP